MEISKRGYYNSKNILIEIIKGQIHRETAFIPYSWSDKEFKLVSQKPIRWLNASAVRYLEKHFKRYDFLQTHMNMYFSLATYKDFPTFSYSRVQKKKEQEVWAEHFHRRIIRYDLFVETDSDEDVMVAHEDTIYLKQNYDRYRLVYSVKASGSKGFHLLTPYEEFEYLGLDIYNEAFHKEDFEKLLHRLPMGLEEMKKNLDIVILFKAIAVRMNTIWACDTVDTTVQDVKRVCKSAYSFDVKSGLVSYPLDDEQFKNFSVDMIRPINVIRNNNFKRGMLWRNLDIPKRERMQSIRKLLQDLAILS